MAGAECYITAQRQQARKREPQGVMRRCPNFLLDGSCCEYKCVSLLWEEPNYEHIIKLRAASQPEQRRHSTKCAETSKIHSRRIYMKSICFSIHQAIDKPSGQMALNGYTVAPLFVHSRLDLLFCHCHESALRAGWTPLAPTVVPPLCVPRLSPLQHTIGNNDAGHCPQLQAIHLEERKREITFQQNTTAFWGRNKAGYRLPRHWQMTPHIPT